MSITPDKQGTAGCQAGTPIHQTSVERTIWVDGSEDTEDVNKNMVVKGMKMANLVKPQSH